VAGSGGKGRHQCLARVYGDGESRPDCHGPCACPLRSAPTSPPPPPPAHPTSTLHRQEHDCTTLERKKKGWNERIEKERKRNTHTHTQRERESSSAEAGMQGNAMRSGGMSDNKPSTHGKTREKGKISVNTTAFRFSRLGPCANEGH